MARPTIYSQELANRICEELMSGKSLRAICDGKSFPGKTTVFRWLGENEAFRELYARARESQAEKYADELVEIADSATSENAQAVRLQVDTRKWVLSKILAKKYGDKIEQQITGKDGAEAIQVVIQQLPPRTDAATIRPEFEK